MLTTKNNFTHKKSEFYTLSGEPVDHRNNNMSQKSVYRLSAMVLLAITILWIIGLIWFTFMVTKTSF